MLDAMMHAKVGDDVFEEDEATKNLEQYCATMFGYGRCPIMSFRYHG
ncbi:hypothetical protein EMGBS15_01540 [Filimonas sp.]|nr:hypothetical protein EMGBS15_01540 [Filimonas sp.]